MAIIKSFAPFQNLTNFEVFEVDNSPNSEYFRITELNETLTGGKNAFLIEGSEHLKETTEVKIEILDVNGNPIYFEPGNGTNHLGCELQMEQALAKEKEIQEAE